MILLIDDQRKSHLVLNHVVVSPLCFVPTYFSYPCLEPISKKSSGSDVITRRFGSEGFKCGC